MMSRSEIVNIITKFMPYEPSSKRVEGLADYILTLIKRVEIEGWNTV